ncbi:hypothetical protein [Kingella oralis]|jgi:hypothetical protein|uniref:Uncharacterized protein n=1 Tax=Kingella oralis ATCC 51147 TaxID=629741 RepID=C4GEC0_9NEIS|nr:hypothetical protein [Kingella oralis]EEP69530.1 hypothetical protein GCWU000324_00002 [Kingella oralis ATCC 51147]QMT42790.1 hypothetical protein H3L93_12790 [Kingella oralis]
MKNLKQIFNYSFPILVAVIGFSSSIVSLFIDLNMKISIKWVIFLIVISLTLICALGKYIFELLKKQSKPAMENPISCMKVNEMGNNEVIFLIRNNENFKYNIFVAGYGKRNQLDTLLFVGFVENAQEKMLQIRVNTWVQEVDLFDLQGNIKQEILSSIEIRPVIPRQAIDVLTNNGGY